MFIYILLSFTVVLVLLAMESLICQRKVQTDVYNALNEKLEFINSMYLRCYVAARKGSDELDDVITFYENKEKEYSEYSKSILSKIKYVNNKWFPTIGNTLTAEEIEWLFNN